MLRRKMLVESQDKFYDRFQKIDEDVEVDVEVLRDQAAQSMNFLQQRTEDPFTKFYDSPEGLSSTEKRRYKRLAKKADELQSKAKSLEQLGSYDLWKLVPPPYDLDALAKL